MIADDRKKCLKYFKIYYQNIKYCILNIKNLFKKLTTQRQKHKQSNEQMCRGPE